LASGHLRHAALDVFNTEPLPAGHKLTTLPNVTLSAHSAFRTPEASDKLIRMALDLACLLPRPAPSGPASGTHR
jgi:D-3-phosphoglycerate dehydrogenase